MTSAIVVIHHVSTAIMAIIPPLPLLEIYTAYADFDRTARQSTLNNQLRY